MCSLRSIKIEDWLALLHTSCMKCFKKKFAIEYFDTIKRIKSKAFTCIHREEIYFTQGNYYFYAYSKNIFQAHSASKSSLNKSSKRLIL